MEITTLTNVKEWPGPENPGVMSMALRHQAFLESICDEIGLETFNEDVGILVDSWGIQEGDSWDVETMKYWLKAWIVTLVKYCYAKNVMVPDWLQDEMAIVNKGTFPVGYSTTSMEVMLVI